jgi:hypothetical protein
MSTKGDKIERFDRIEPSHRWVRAQVGDEFVVDWSLLSLVFGAALLWGQAKGRVSGHGWLKPPLLPKKL